MDEYQFVIVPVVLGGGRTVFSNRLQVQLVDQLVFRPGQVVLTWRPLSG